MVKVTHKSVDSISNESLSEFILSTLSTSCLLMLARLRLFAFIPAAIFRLSSFKYYSLFDVFLNDPSQAVNCG